MAECANGHQMAEGAAFCSSCGSPVKAPVSAFCASCGNPREVEEAFCTSCGTPFLLVPTPPPPRQAPPSGTYQYAAPQSTMYQTTPQWPGMDIGLPLAGPGSLANQGNRLLAQIIDDVLVFASGFIVALIFDSILSASSSACNGYGCTAAAGTGFLAGILLDFLFVGLIGILYEPFMLGKYNYTLGMKALNIRVHRLDNIPELGYGKSFGRSAVKWLPGIIPFVGFIFELINFGWCLWDPNRQCLHDKAVNTVVINTK